VASSAVEALAKTDKNASFTGSRELSIIIHGFAWLVFLIIMVMVGFLASGQSTPTEVTPDGYVLEPDYQYIWGATSDTLTNADTLNYVWRVRGFKTYDVDIKLYQDHVSGTPSGTLVAYESIDGVNYEATGDTITFSSLAADAMDSETIDLGDFLAPYLKVTLLQSGTGVHVPKVYLYAKEN